METPASLLKRRIAGRLPPEQPSPEKVAVKLFILQGEAEPLSSVPVRAEPSQLLLGNWLSAFGPHSVYPDLARSHLDDWLALSRFEQISHCGRAISTNGSGEPDPKRWEVVQHDRRRNERFSLMYSSWFGKPVVTLVVIRQCRVPMTCSIVDESPRRRTRPPTARMGDGYPEEFNSSR